MLENPFICRLNTNIFLSQRLSRHFTIEKYC